MLNFRHELKKKAGGAKKLSLYLLEKKDLLFDGFSLLPPSLRFEN